MSGVIGMVVSAVPTTSKLVYAGTSLGAAGAVGMVLLAPTTIVADALAARETAEKMQVMLPKRNSMRLSRTLGNGLMR